MKKSPGSLRALSYKLLRNEELSYASASDVVRTKDLSTPQSWLTYLTCLAMCGRLETRKNPEHHFELRRELLYILTLKKLKLDQRRERALEYILEHVESLLGLDELLDSDTTHPLAADYQLDRDHAWWTQGDFERTQSRRRELEDQLSEQPDELAGELERAGYDLISRDDYVARVRADLLAELSVIEQERLDWVARVVLLYTSTRSSFTEHDDPTQLCVLPANARGLVTRWVRELSRTTTPMFAVPRDPLATLSGEANNIGLLAAGVKAEHGRFKYLEEDTGQLSLLLYDTDLVLKDSGLPDTYIKVPLNVHARPEQGSELSLLLHSLSELSKLGPQTRQAYFKDIPRIIAGMFLAATHDTDLGLSMLQPGQFLDAESGRRLTGIVGLDGEQNRHVKRVRAVRDWLTKIQLVRELRSPRPNERISWSGPIVHRLPDEITVTEQLPDGLSRARSNIYIWRLSPELWNLRTMGSGAEDYMLLDQKAFQLDQGLQMTTSEPFNLYWTVVQRAYKAASARNPEERFDADGRFRPRAAMLYRWSGMELRSDERHPHRIRERMRDYLVKMVDKGLVVDWSCPYLESDEEHFQREKFAHVRISIQLPSSLLMFLPQDAFVAGANPFKRTRVV